MKKPIVFAAMVSLLASPSVLQAQGETVFRPSGQWVLDYGEDYCRLGRVFSDGQDDMELAIERVRPGPQLRLWFVGDTIRTFRGANTTGYAFLPSQAEREVAPIRASSGGKQVISLPEVTIAPITPPARGAPPGPPPAYDPAAEKTAADGVTAIRLGKGLTRPVTVETGPLGGAITALQACTDDLVKTWGVDPQKHGPDAVQAVPQGFPWLPAGTIGFGDFAKLAGNTNQVRLTVDPAGKATSCQIVWPTLSADQNAKICEVVLDKATFTPAQDAEGQAIASYWMGSPMFLMPAPGGARR